jgi:hypothetical protein
VVFARRCSETIQDTSAASPSPPDEREWTMRTQFDLERAAAATLARE